MKMFLYKSYFFFVGIGTFISNIFYKIFFKTAPILLYHRIDSVKEDPIKLVVTPECFEKHLLFLKKNYDILPLSKLSERLLAGTLMGNEIAITFDDGYKDNLTNALPLLEKHGVPATVFITTGQLGQKASFAWDLQYGEADMATFLSEAEIKILSDHPLIEIGAHTDTHPRLVDLSAEEQGKEILQSKMILEQITSKKIISFAYPFGGIYDFNEVTEKAVKEAGFHFAYTNTSILAKITAKPLRIPRINIREDSKLPTPWSK